jgi:hypothetical protein
MKTDSVDERMNRLSSLKESLSTEKLQIGVFITISLIILLFTIALYLIGTPRFEVFFGSINPVFMISLIIMLGLGLVSILLSQEWVDIYRREHLKGLFLISLLTVPFALGAILVDLVFPYPEDINVLLPQSLLFYPTMGFVVEILFHLLPLTLLLVLLTSVFKGRDFDRIFLVIIVIISLLEPLYQFDFSGTGHPIWISAIEGLRLFLFSYVQLSILKKYDFLSMYSFRIFYYIWWHLVWGTIRLVVLF